MNNSPFTAILKVQNMSTMLHKYLNTDLKANVQG